MPHCLGQRRAREVQEFLALWLEYGFCGLALQCGWQELAVTKVAADLWPLRAINFIFPVPNCFSNQDKERCFAPLLLSKWCCNHKLLLLSWELLWCWYVISLFVGFLVTCVCKASWTTGSHICLLPVIALVGSLFVLRPLAQASLSCMGLDKPSLISLCWFTESWHLCFAPTVWHKFQSPELLFSPHYLCCVFFFSDYIYCYFFSFLGGEGKEKELGSFQVVWKTLQECLHLGVLFL